MTDTAQPRVPLLRLDRELPAPGYAHPGDAGADLRIAVDVTLAPGERRTVPTGVALALPAGYAAFVHPRSGLAARHGLTVVNAPGTVDAGYRGEIQVTLLNTDRDSPVRLCRGDRIAQLVVQRVERVEFVEVDRLPGSVRGEGGFGSTGGFGPGQARDRQDPRTDRQDPQDPRADRQDPQDPQADRQDPRAGGQDPRAGEQDRATGGQPVVSGEDPRSRVEVAGSVPGRGGTQ